MKKPQTHVNILGVEIPLATIAYATSTPRLCATLGDWHSYFSAGDVDLLKSLTMPSAFEALASRRSGHIPVDAGVSRQFFTYAESPVKSPAYDGVNDVTGIDLMPVDPKSSNSGVPQ